MKCSVLKRMMQDGLRLWSCAVVLSLAATAGAQETNVAPGGTASQSTTGFGGVAARAIDANTNGAFGGNSVTHTNTGDPTPSWQVDLGAPFDIVRVVIWNRTDCCHERLTDFRLSVTGGGQDHVGTFFTDQSFPNPNVEIPLPAGTNGQVVRIERLGPDSMGGLWLSLAEVQVFAPVTDPPSILIQPVGGVITPGCSVTLSAVVDGAASVQWLKDGSPISGATEQTYSISGAVPDDSGSYQIVGTNDIGETTSDAAVLDISGPTNWAALGTAVLSSEEFGGAAGRSNDCNTSGVYGNGSVSHTATGDPDPFWEVDLGANRPIGSIVVWNRTDACCVARLANTQVVVLDGDGAEVFSGEILAAPAPSATLMTPPGTFGRYVRVQYLDPASVPDADRFLNIAEVQVFAPASALETPDLSTAGILTLIVLGLAAGSLLLGSSRNRRAAPQAAA